VFEQLKLNYGNSCPAETSTKRHCSPLIDPWNVQSRYFCTQTPPLPSGSLSLTVQADRHPYTTESDLFCHPGSKNRCQPASIITLLWRHQRIPAAKMSRCTQQAYILLHWTACTVKSAACTPRRYQLGAGPKMPKTHLLSNLPATYTLVMCAGDSKERTVNAYIIFALEQDRGWIFVIKRLSSVWSHVTSNSRR